MVACWVHVALTESSATNWESQTHTIDIVSNEFLYNDNICPKSSCRKSGREYFCNWPMAEILGCKNLNPVH